jgi:ribosomal-protein-alanine N-acetyltransferase
MREFRSEDVAQVAVILREAPEAAQWPESELRSMGYLSGLRAFVSESLAGITGVVIGRQVAEEAEILNLAVRVSARRRGEGTALVGRILDEFAGQGVSRVFLEVRESNATAVGFYERLGFQQVGVRRNYYQDPVESAKVMELWVRKSTESQK